MFDKKSGTFFFLFGVYLLQTQIMQFECLFIHVISSKDNSVYCMSTVMMPFDSLVQHKHIRNVCELLKP